MTYDDMLPRIHTYAPHVPPGTARRHLNDAARTFARRTLCWNYQHPSLLAVLNQAEYGLSLGAGEQLVKVLACDVNNGQTYTVQNGSLGRRLVREASGSRVCVVALPGTITLSPVPPIPGQPIVLDVAVMPDESGDTEWPDELEEHVEYIAAGALGTLCAMPNVSWSSPATAVDQREKFYRRIDAVYHTVAATLQRPAKSGPRWF